MFYVIEIGLTNILCYYSQLFSSDNQKKNNLFKPYK